MHCLTRDDIAIVQIFNRGSYMCSCFIEFIERVEEKR